MGSHFTVPHSFPHLQAGSFITTGDRLTLDFSPSPKLKFNSFPHIQRGGQRSYPVNVGFYSMLFIPLQDAVSQQKHTHQKSKSYVGVENYGMFFFFSILLKNCKQTCISSGIRPRNRKQRTTTTKKPTCYNMDEP